LRKLDVGSTIKKEWIESNENVSLIFFIEEVTRLVKYSLFTENTCYAFIDLVISYARNFIETHEGELSQLRKGMHMFWPRNVLMLMYLVTIR